MIIEHPITDIFTHGITQQVPKIGWCRIRELEKYCVVSYRIWKNLLLENYGPRQLLTSVVPRLITQWLSV